MSKRREDMRLALPGPNDVLDTNAANKECVANQRSMASPRYRFGTHQRTALTGRHVHHPFNVLGELRRLHVIGVATK